MTRRCLLTPDPRGKVSLNNDCVLDACNSPLYLLGPKITERENVTFNSN